MGQLRDDFAAASGEPRLHGDDDSVTVTVDDFEWPAADEEADEHRAATSLVVTGPVQAQRGIDRLQRSQQRGRLDDVDFLADLNAVMRDAGARAAGAADRDAQMGGRDLLDAYVRADRAVLGWARVTAPNPCWFCAILASRGAVYRSAWTARYRGSGSGRRTLGADLPQGWEDWSPSRLADWEASRGVNRFHDNCHCTLIPVYSREDWIPPESQAFRELYYESTRGLSGPAARAAFRAAVEARRRRAEARGVSVR
ncbi:VG15 protein [Streptomyces sp. NPDC001880]